MKILITNDDGIDSLGIRTMVKVLSQEHTLYVVAPDRERSATGHSLTLHQPLRIESVNLGVPNTIAWETTGTPTDCIKLALCSLLGDIKIDLVITGINHGPNLGADVLYSGTVNAALEGAIYSIPSIAMSLTNGHLENADFMNPSLFLLEFLKELPKLSLPKKTIININYPNNTEPKLSNIRVSKLGTRMYSDCYEKRLDPRGKTYYWLCGEPIEDDESPDSDVVAVKEGFISITPIHIKLTDKETLDSLNKYFSEKDK